MRILRSSLPLLLVVLGMLSACRDADGWITIQNDTGANLVAVFIDPCGSAGPTNDRLGGSVIAPGARTAFDVEFGCYDVLVRGDGGLEGRWNVGVNAADRNVTLVARPQEP